MFRNNEVDHRVWTGMTLLLHSKCGVQVLEWYQQEIAASYDFRGDFIFLGINNAVKSSILSTVRVVLISPHGELVWRWAVHLIRGLYG